MQKFVIIIVDEVVQSFEDVSSHFVPRGHLSQKLMQIKKKKKGKK